MIENIKQYYITKRWIEVFQESIDQSKFYLETAPENIDPLLVEIQLAAMEGQLETLREEVREWETKNKSYG